MSVTRFGDGVPLNEKGQIVTHDGTTAISIPVGSNGQILTAQSSTSSGLLWANVNTGDTQYVKLIASTVLTAAAHSVTFSSIPATYDELLLIMQAKRTDSADHVISGIEINSTSTTTYRYASYNYGADGADTNTGTTYFPYRLGGSEPTIMEISFPAYTSNASKVVTYRSTFMQNSLITSGNTFFHGVWDNAGVIDTITIYAGAPSSASTTFGGGTLNQYWILYGVNWS
jgi:hypothetical protein